MDLQGAWAGALLNRAMGSLACRCARLTERHELNQNTKLKLHGLELHDVQQIMRYLGQHKEWSQGRQQQSCWQPWRIQSRARGLIQRHPMQWHRWLLQRDSGESMGPQPKKCCGAGDSARVMSRNSG